MGMKTMKALVSAAAFIMLLMVLWPGLAVTNGTRPLDTVATCPVASTAPARVQPRPQYADTHELCIEIRDFDTGDSIAARVGVFGPNGDPVRPEDRESHIYQFSYSQSYFYADGAACVSVPRGEITVYAGKGFEFFPVDTVMQVTSDTTVVLHLERFIDMAAEGWFAGDTHVHLTHSPLVYSLDASDLLFMARAEELNFINSMESESFFTGALDTLSKPDRLLFFSKEQGNPYFAHLTLLGIKQWPPRTRCEAPLGTSFCGGTLNKAIYDLIHSQGDGVAVIAAHPFPTFNLWNMAPWPGSGVWRGMPLDLVSGAVDAMDILSYSHAWPPAGVEAYFHALNAGFRLPSSAGTDTGMGQGTSRPPGGYRIFVMPPGEDGLTLDGWIAGLRAGRSFVTNYPLITEFELDGHSAGDVIEHDGRILCGRVSAQCIEPLDTLTIIGNGTVLGAFTPDPGSQGREISGEFKIDARDVTWIVARVTGRPSGTAAQWHNMDANGMFAQTAPIYLEHTITDAKNRDPMSLVAAPEPRRDAANFFLDFLDQLQAIFDTNGDFPGDSRVAFDQAMYASRHHYDIVSGDPPGAFDLVGPCKTWNKPHAVVQTSRPTFVWQRAIDPDPSQQASYVLMIDTLPSFDTATLISTGGDTMHTPSIKDSLLEGVTYYWRVRAYDPTGFEVASTTDCCTLMVTFDPTGIPHDAPSVSWSIGGIYPNPSDKYVHITYTLPADDGLHAVSVYDVNGRLVRRLYQGHRGGGTRRLNWDGRRADGTLAASGVYFVRLAPVGLSPIVKKVVVLR
jgi:hypothetical protein